MEKNTKPKPSAKGLSGKPNRNNKYEHHNDIKSNPLTPFKVRKSANCHTATCNWHDNLELLYVTGGNGIVRCGTRNIEMLPESVIIINSQTMHSISSEDGVDYCMYIIDNSFFRENGIDVTGCTFENVSSDERLINVCREVYNVSVSEKGPLYNARLRAAFLALVLELCENHMLNISENKKEGSCSEQYVKKAMEYINDNYTEKINLEGIAKVIGINKSYFAREFRKYAGQTVHTYINSLRCAMADRCLAEGMSVTEAAMESGFGTLSYFSRTYKKLRGFSPISAKEQSYGASVLQSGGM